MALTELTGYTRFRRVLHIVVNAQKERVATDSARERSPGPARVLLDATSLTMDRYTFETVEAYRRSIEDWIAELKTARCVEDPVADCEDVAAYFIELNLAQHPDVEERRFLVNLPTSFRLEHDAVDRVVAAGKVILEQSSGFSAFRAEVASMQ